MTAAPSQEAAARDGAAANLPRPGYWALVAAGEPFRFLFVLGVVLGVIGVALWPLYIWNITAMYPGQAHARVMIEGFLASFVVGFLGTALPRLLGVPKFTIFETLGFAAALCTVTALHVMGRIFWGDVVFLLLLLGFVTAVVVRFFLREDVPPPGFVLAGLGLLCALTGTIFYLLPHVAPSFGSPWRATMARLLLFQGFPLLPVLGVGAFLLPRFFQLPSRHAFPESSSLPPGWVARAALALACGVAVIASFALEADGQLRWGAGLRAAVIAGYFASEVPFFRKAGEGGSITLGVRIALLCIPVGYALVAVWPERMSSWLHVVFISGFGMLTLMVATRVVFGHSGQSHLFAAPLKSVRVFTALIVLAMLTRVSADWMPDVRMSHYAYAAVAWIAGALVWAIAILPSVRKPDDEP
jgi:uncharacterized protein involved in response to NO